MPIKKECTICKVRHPEHPKLINVKEFEEKYTPVIEEEEWEKQLDKIFPKGYLFNEDYCRVRDFIKSLLISKEEEIKNTIAKDYTVIGGHMWNRRLKNKELIVFLATLKK